MKKISNKVSAKVSRVQYYECSGYFTDIYKVNIKITEEGRSDWWTFAIYVESLSGEYNKEDKAKINEWLANAEMPTSLDDKDSIQAFIDRVRARFAYFE